MVYNIDAKNVETILFDFFSLSIANLVHKVTKELRKLGRLLHKIKFLIKDQLFLGSH
jgi:hypothetical protein